MVEEKRSRRMIKILLVDVIMMGLINMKINFRVYTSNSRREQDSITMGQLQQLEHQDHSKRNAMDLDE